MRKKCLMCGASTPVPDGDYDTPAVCESCVLENTEDVEATRRAYEQIGAAFIGHQREEGAR